MKAVAAMFIASGAGPLIMGFHNPDEAPRNLLCRGEIRELKLPNSVKSPSLWTGVNHTGYCDQVTIPGNNQRLAVISLIFPGNGSFFPGPRLVTDPCRQNERTG